MGLPRGKGPAEPVHAVRRTGQPGPRFNYELFNCNNFNIRYWSWNYRGCWPSLSRIRALQMPLEVQTYKEVSMIVQHDECYITTLLFQEGLARTLSY